jgi:septum formation protein
VKPLILASSSPRRFDLLTAVGLAFTVARPDIDETPQPGEAPADYVLRLSLQKAWAVSTGSMASLDSGVILSADTTVVDGDQILGKPDDAEHAAAMLRQLRNRVHVVHTGITLLDAGSGQSTSRLTTTRVTMRPYTDEEIAAYVASGDPIGKAGGYAIQHAGFHPVARLDGCYTNVVGLPLCTVIAALAEYGIWPRRTITCSPTRPPCEFGPQV